MQSEHVVLQRTDPTIWIPDFWPVDVRSILSRFLPYHVINMTSFILQNEKSSIPYQYDSSHCNQIPQSNQNYKTPTTINQPTNQINQISQSINQSTNQTKSNQINQSIKIQTLTLTLILILIRKWHRKKKRLLKRGGNFKRYNSNAGLSSSNPNHNPIISYALY